ncbi:MAG: hypothetical protein J6X89_04345 [Bacteroidales bacterium]|nr:hypothetical protein [Bacteroidales bacterium]
MQPASCGLRNNHHNPNNHVRRKDTTGHQGGDASSGGVGGSFIYRICPKTLPALIVSHALWDALVFVVMPI